MVIRAKIRSRQRGQASLIGLLVVVAILMILAYMYLPQVAGEHSAPGGPATPREQAYGAACSEYESQLNQAVFMYKTDHDDKPPRNLEELKQYGVTDDQIHAEGCYFQIDPVTGHVSDLGQGKYVPVNPPASVIYGGHATGFHPDDALPQAPSPSPAPISTLQPSPPPSDGSPTAPVGSPPTVGPGGIKIPTIPTENPDL